MLSTIFSFKLQAAEYPHLDPRRRKKVVGTTMEVLHQGYERKALVTEAMVTEDPKFIEITLELI